MNKASRTETKPEGLHICPQCRSDLVQPVRWEQAEQRNRWRLWRRCPECEWDGVGIYGEAEIDAYDETLDEGADEVSRELDELARERMRDLTEAFSAALAADLITADDFR